MPWIIDVVPPLPPPPPPARAMAVTPPPKITHLALPLRYVGGHVVVNEQDSIDDLVDCVYAICVTNPGDREELPDFGLVDFTFDQEPLPLSAAINQIEAWEPRVSILIDQAPNRFDDATVTANVNVAPIKKDQ